MQHGLDGSSGTGYAPRPTSGDGSCAARRCAAKVIDTDANGHLCVVVALPSYGHGSPSSCTRRRLLHSTYRTGLRLGATLIYIHAYASLDH